MRKILCTILILSVFFINAVCFSYADGKEYADLYKAREEYIDSLRDDPMAFGESSRASFSYFPAVTDLHILLYLKQSEEWTYETTGDEIEINTGFWSGVVCREIYQAVCGAYNQEAFGGPGVRAWQPPLMLCIRALHIGKEDLRAARDRMQNDPYSIRSRFPLVIDEQFDLEINLARSERYLEDFMIDALYLEDQNETIGILLAPYALYTPVGTITSYNLPFMTEDDLTPYSFDADQYRSFSDFTHQCGDLSEHSLKLLKYMDERFLTAEQTPDGAPDTGDGTSLFLLLFVLGAGACAATFAVVKKRRTGK